jgi:hypothetical protein
MKLGNHNTTVPLFWCEDKGWQGESCYEHGDELLVLTKAENFLLISAYLYKVLLHWINDTVTGCSLWMRTSLARKHITQKARTCNSSLVVLILMCIKQDTSWIWMLSYLLNAWRRVVRVATQLRGLWPTGHVSCLVSAFTCSVKRNKLKFLAY